MVFVRLVFWSKVQNRLVYTPLSQCRGNPFILSQSVARTSIPTLIYKSTHFKGRNCCPLPHKQRLKHSVCTDASRMLLVFWALAGLLTVSAAPPHHQPPQIPSPGTAPLHKGKTLQCFLLCPWLVESQLLLETILVFDVGSIFIHRRYTHSRVKCCNYKGSSFNC